MALGLVAGSGRVSASQEEGSSRDGESWRCSSLFGNAASFPDARSNIVIVVVDFRSDITHSWTTDIIMLDFKCTSPRSSSIAEGGVCET